MNHTSTQAPKRLTANAAESLATRMVEEMTGRWRRGETPLVEEFLDRAPVLWDHPEAVADLIYEEFCLRQERDGEPNVKELLDRFPQWRPQLEVLFDCQRLLVPQPPIPALEPGNVVGEFLLLSELGRGAQGRVFLASQSSLGHRPVVLKIIPHGTGEHLTLARLQHTNVVPLYSAQEFPERGVQILCMPYFGGVTLSQLLELSGPLQERSGAGLLAALDRLQALRPVDVSRKGPGRTILECSTYVQSICWIVASLADGLHCAHQSGLIHLDIKPSNVLLTAAGQPMLLDFHLACPPLPAGEFVRQRLGGTPGYFSPEQREALHAMEQGETLTHAVDGRSDVYSLGLLLCEALAGMVPRTGEYSLIRPRNGQVSVGLQDVIDRCLAPNPQERYSDAAALASDLRRHLADLPLKGVSNRSLRERWEKWRRRRPHRTALMGMMLAVLLATSAVGLGIAAHCDQRIGQSRKALRDGQTQIELGQWDTAIATLNRGEAAVAELPWTDDLTAELRHKRRQAEEGRVAADRAACARELHHVAEDLRFLWAVPQFSPEQLQRLEPCYRSLWEGRRLALERLHSPGQTLDPIVRADLLELALFWAELQLHLTPEPESARLKALAILDEAEAMLGSNTVLDLERERHGYRNIETVRVVSPVSEGPTDETWEHYARGRSYLRRGDLERAAEELQQAIHLRPQALWPNFYLGLCAARQGRHEEAILAYSVCIGAASAGASLRTVTAQCYYHRALSLEALGRRDEACRDMDLARR